MQDVLTGSFLATVYNPDLIKKILSCLTPDNSRYVIFVFYNVFDLQYRVKICRFEYMVSHVLPSDNQSVAYSL